MHENTLLLHHYLRFWYMIDQIIDSGWSIHMSRLSVAITLSATAASSRELERRGGQMKFHLLFRRGKVRTHDAW